MELVGLEFDNDPAGVSYRISALWEPDARGRARYLIEFSEAAGAWQSLCNEGDYAYALPGSFASTTRGAYVGSGPFGMFACGTSATAKAIRWGLSPSDAHGADFSAAVRLARAEYCADGVTHTVNGTPVVIATLHGVTGAPMSDDGPSSGSSGAGSFYFEAAWHGKGTDVPTSNFVSTPADWAVVCLSKLRWQSLPPGGYCPHVVPDPRQATEFDPDHWVFCDDLPGFSQVPTAAFLASVRDRFGATVASLSQFNDRGYWIWKQRGTNDYAGTTTGFWAGDLGSSDRPFEGYDFDGHPQLVAHVSSWNAPNTKPLYIYVNSHGDYRTTTVANLDAPCTQFLCISQGWVKKGGPIGYVYNDSTVPEGESPVALRQWVRRNPANKFFPFDTVLLPDTATPPAGYVLETGGVEGYAF